MKKQSTVGLLIGAAVIIAIAGTATAQDPAPLPATQPSPISPEMLSPQSPQQPEAPAGTQLGMAISYQGQLQKGGGAYNGTCNFQFSLWDAATSGTQRGSTLTRTSLTVANGLFSTELDFGNPFWGEKSWLETSVQCAGDASYTKLSPRQPQNAVPYAMGLFPGASIRGTNASSVLELVNTTGGAGVAGYSRGTAGNSWGVHGQSENSIGVHGYSVNGGTGVFGNSPKGTGVFGASEEQSGGFFTSKNGNGAYIESNSGRRLFDGAALQVMHKNGGSGIAIWARSAGTNPANPVLVLESPGGSLIKGFGGNGGEHEFIVENDGSIGGKQLTITGGSDLAERFSQADGTVAEPGTVMVIDADHPGHIKPSTGAYDRKVAGIVSGAGDIRPGLTLHQEGVAEGDTVMAIAGRVYVKAEALSSPIAPGDLLTTSDIPGLAMKASDDARSHGAVIGKAMTGLESGTGLVLVIVNLQ
jgi:hypothetical protein